MQSAEAADIVLRTQRLGKSFKGFVAVRDVDLQVRRGSIHALIGPNGAGKTTVFNLLTRFLPASSGRIEFDGVDITQTAPAAVSRRGLVRSFQISATFSNLSALQNVRVALQRKTGLSASFWRSDRVLRQLDDRARALLTLGQLQAQADTPAGQLSYGRKRVLEMLTTLALEPTMLLLDEPMAGLGHEDVARVTRLIRDAAVGRTVLMVEHNLSVVRDLCDTITVLQRGEIIAQGGYDSVAADARVREAYIGSEDD